MPISADNFIKMVLFVQFGSTFQHQEHLFEKQVLSREIIQHGPKGGSFSGAPRNAGLNRAPG